jgi:hypothetical protein
MVIPVITRIFPDKKRVENTGIFGGEPLFPGTSGDNGNGKNKPGVKTSPHDFKKLDFPDLHPCSAYGKKLDSRYIEKLIPRRKKDPTMGDSWYLCQKCYQHAVKKHRSVSLRSISRDDPLAAL